MRDTGCCAEAAAALRAKAVTSDCVRASASWDLARPRSAPGEESREVLRVRTSCSRREDCSCGQQRETVQIYKQTHIHWQIRGS